jgi:hypothetical protein
VLAGGLQPSRTIHLEGFSGFGAAALHSATETGFKVATKPVGRTRGPQPDGGALRLTD